VLRKSFMPTGPVPSLGQFIDIEVLALPGSRAKTAVEFAALFERRAFKLTKIVPTKLPLSVVEAERIP
jgi:hypothetical protein